MLQVDIIGVAQIKRRKSGSAGSGRRCSYKESSSILLLLRLRNNWTSAPRTSQLATILGGTKFLISITSHAPSHVGTTNPPLSLELPRTPTTAARLSSTAHGITTSATTALSISFSTRTSWALTTPQAASPTRMAWVVCL
ncbi:hypothetical protein EJ03DRAFT_84608 [Teratosphaeria nubilosa]|uniref:Uncharacterized protein n=1 Tax=Teratosphaeria nubilosa TaxID=161662 RepID=A0A6G1LAG4_9PEZI|nr:hypothetical protein EJ03DRAFT_84608 [Teratosphaeria nubilosa]